MTVLVDEPCASCGAPLGADQRYCLSCGIPRAGTRLPFLDVLHREAASAGVIERGSQPAALLRMPALGAGKGFGLPPGGWWDGEGGLAARLRENSGLFALLGVLLLALLIGLLLGHWVSSSAKNIASVPAKQVIEVKGLPAAAAAPATGVAGSSTSPAAAEPTTSSPAGESAHAAPAKHASNPTVSSLAQSTGKEHAKAVEKALSNSKEGSLSTGGAPPPKETSKSGASKPIGGGSEVTSIE
ncbi:MAG TPA: zinc ribbon domain-containing protein [Solirubrobacteraceae bacterium]|jgi:hypothetical protein|nr:zinc ribbon domain-containing protein [Solirubrobacteraceae bacterium]